MSNQLDAAFGMRDTRCTERATAQLSSDGAKNGGTPFLTTRITNNLAYSATAHYERRRSTEGIVWVFCVSTFCTRSSFVDLFSNAKPPTFVSHERRVDATRWWSTGVYMDLNKVTLIGNMVRDPEAKSLRGGQQLTRVSLPTNYAWKG